MFTSSYNEHIKYKELKEHKRKPIAAFQSTQLMEELRRRRQKQEEDESWHQLNHCLMPGNSLKGLSGYWFEQPATQHEKTRKTE